MGGKGGSTKTTSTQQGTSATQLPDWLSNAAEQGVLTAQNLSDIQNLFQPYQGQQVASVPQASQTAYGMIQNMPNVQDPAYQQAQGLYGQAGANLGQQQGAYSQLANLAQPITAGGVNQLSNQLYGNYQQNVMQPAQGLLGGYLQGGPLTAGQVGANTQALMSPYTSSVINPTQQLMQQSLAQNLQQVGAGANQAGAFGGTRQGVQEGVAQAQSALGSEQYLGNLLNTQWNNALTPAYNIGSLASQQGYNAASALANMGQAGYNAAASQGANIAGTNLGLGTTGLAGLGTNATGQQALASNQLQGAGTYQNLLGNQAQLLQSVGTAQQQQAQAEMNAQIGNYYATQNMPIQNLDMLLGAVSGVPYGTTSMTQGTATGTQATQPGLLNQITGGIGLGAKIGSMFTPTPTA